MAAAEAMRRILVENARRKQRLKHGGQWQRVALNEADEGIDQVSREELIDLDDALTQLAAEAPVKAKLVQLRFFAGLSNEDAAEALGISAVTAKRYWRYSRAWLHRAMSKGDDSPG